jgi:hypothetical protein
MRTPIEWKFDWWAESGDETACRLYLFETLSVYVVDCRQKTASNFLKATAFSLREPHPSLRRAKNKGRVGTARGKHPRKQGA